ncbi:MAG: methyltransferase domain-containing protein, partial [Actinomycetota bacterium]|nr:methyltransferase domain-containing protein [Actinomycetota bacterium]
MHAETVGQYDHLAAEWIEASEPDAVELAALIGGDSSGPVLDLGCGPGWHLAQLGTHATGLDASLRMVRAASARSGRPIVQADLEHLPYATRSAGGAWAAKSYVHLPRTQLPMAYRELHRVLRPGARIGLQLFLADRPDTVGGRKVPGRLFSFVTETQLADLLEGAGFTLDAFHHLDDRARIGSPEAVERSVAIATRQRTLADSVGPDMRVLLSGLNPSLHAADAGYGFAGPSNRFWPAALDSGLVSTPRDPT